MANWALIIAVENYPNMTSGMERNLPGTNAAAEAFRTWVATKKVPIANVIACAGAECDWRTAGTTRGEIVGAIAELVGKARDICDELYVYFAGHGFGFSADPDEPAIDVLLGSDFSRPVLSGSVCIRFQEVKERLRVALGPGKHFYFIDACRNQINSTEIRPAIFEVVLGRSKRGNATTYTLFSTSPGEIAVVATGFNDALLSGLRGGGRAKVWDGGTMYVTFDSLCGYVQKRLGKSDLDPEKKGPADGKIVELRPVPQQTCEISVVDAQDDDSFLLKISDVRNGQRDPVSFTGVGKAVTLTADDYIFRLESIAGGEVPQVDPPSNTPVDLYDNGHAVFQKRPPLPPPPPLPLEALTAQINVSAVPGTELLLRHINTGEIQAINLRTDRDRIEGLAAGAYKAELRDGKLMLAKKSFELKPAEDFALDLSPKVVQGAHESIANSIPQHNSLVDFSETLGPIPDWNLDLWLALLGASRIVADPTTYSKLQSFELGDFHDATRGDSFVYVIAGQVTPDAVPACGIGSDPDLKAMEEGAGLPGVFWLKEKVDPGRILVTYGNQAEGTTTVATRGLPNRATFLTFSENEQRRRTVQQFILPVHLLVGFIGEREQQYIRSVPPLRLVRYMSTAQRLFAGQVPLQGNAYENSDQYWWDLLYAKWLNPVMALIACYELVRRGGIEREHATLKEVVGNMRNFFPGFPDTEIIAGMIGMEAQATSDPPLLTDGIVAANSQIDFPLPIESLDYSSMWTTWKNAVRIKATALAAV